MADKMKSTTRRWLVASLVAWAVLGAVEETFILELFITGSIYGAIMFTPEWWWREEE